MALTAGEMIECTRQASRAAMLDICTSITGKGMALIASCSGTPCWVSPAGFTSAPCALSMLACRKSISAPSWLDWMMSSVTPSSWASFSRRSLICASVVVP
ncbi:hypothetical protein D3C85_1690720 [compost metagenome]